MSTISNAVERSRRREKMSIRFSDVEVIGDPKGRFRGRTRGGKIEEDRRASDKMEKVEPTPLANLASKHSPFLDLPPPLLRNFR